MIKCDVFTRLGIGVQLCPVPTAFINAIHRMKVFLCFRLLCPYHAISSCST